ncbi:MAG: hypothetical protein ABR976_17255 [Terracidiphilus sp.]
MPKPTQEQLLYALAAIDFGSVYAEDGAADGSITEEWRDSESGPEAAAFEKVKMLAELKDAAIPLLIEHLNDTHPTRTLFKGRPVLLGHIALDVLSHFIGQNKHVFDLDCADDGLGACFNPGYYFRPDASLTEMNKVKGKWRKLHREGRIAFAYPQLWN